MPNERFEKRLLEIMQSNSFCQYGSKGGNNATLCGAYPESTERMIKRLAND